MTPNCRALISRSGEKGPEYLRRVQDVHAAAGPRGSHVAQAGGLHHARARLARRDARVRQAPLGRERASSANRRWTWWGAGSRADGPNMAWFADITYVKTRQGWLYLALVMDIWSRRIVGWSMGPNITAELADEALRMALARRNPPEGCVHHSDHGSQYVSLLLSKTMRENGVRPSMGSISSPWGQRCHGVAHGHREGRVRARAGPTPPKRRPHWICSST